MTPLVKRPSREQTREAFQWLAHWHTEGPQPGEEDLSASALQILGVHAYRVIVTGARDWQRRNNSRGAA